MPMADVCCGRPLYDYGFLDMAERWWMDLLGKLQATIGPVSRWWSWSQAVGLHFKTSYPICCPTTKMRRRLKELTFTLSDFLRSKAPDYCPPQLRVKAVVHGHCHQKALDTLNDKEFGKLAAEKGLFRK